MVGQEQEDCGPAQRRRRFARVQLYVLVTEAVCRSDWWSAAVDAIEAGADCIQLREPTLADGELLKRAARLSALCRRCGALFVVNNRPDIARLVRADGVHIGQDDLPVAAVRRIVDPHVLVGKSTHTLAQAVSAAREGADYVAVGPMFASSTKPQSHIAGPQTLRQVLAELGGGVPCVAIGGITAQNLTALLAVGCRSVAVCQSVIGRDDVRAATQELKRLLDRAGPRR